VAGYLSRDHRDSTGRGCVVAALGSEIAKQPEHVREVFTKELEEALDFLTGLMPRTGCSYGYDDAIVAFAAMAGGLILARAVNDEKMSNRILKATARRLGHLTESASLSAISGRTFARTKSSRLAKECDLPGTVERCQGVGHKEASLPEPRNVSAAVIGAGGL
jgi:hypothetical protein